MGQQQLLLIVLSTVIVGIAIVAGINMFTDGSTQNARLQLENQLMDIAGKSHIWYKKPKAMGGGGGSFLLIDNAALNVSADSTVVDSIGLTGTATDVTITLFGSVDGDGNGTNMQVQTVVQSTGAIGAPSWLEN